MKEVIIDKGELNGVKWKLIKIGKQFLKVQAEKYNRTFSKSIPYNGRVCKKHVLQANYILSDIIEHVEKTVDY